MSKTLGIEINNIKSSNNGKLFTYLNIMPLTPTGCVGFLISENVKKRTLVNSIGQI